MKKVKKDMILEGKQNFAQKKNVAKKCSTYIRK